MKTKDILEKIANGAILCMEHTLQGKLYWLEPSRVTVTPDQAESIIPILEPGGDRLFDDFAAQTWRAK